jgi:hypothetical protein
MRKNLKKKFINRKKSTKFKKKKKIKLKIFLRKVDEIKILLKNQKLFFKFLSKIFI